MNTRIKMNKVCIKCKKKISVKVFFCDRCVQNLSVISRLTLLRKHFEKENVSFNQTIFCNEPKKWKNKTSQLKKNKI